MCSDVFNASVKFELYLLNFLVAAVQGCNPHAEHARYCLARFEEALDVDETALENVVQERRMLGVEFIWNVLSEQINPYRCSVMVAGRRPWQPAQDIAS